MNACQKYIKYGIIISFWIFYASSVGFPRTVEAPNETRSPSGRYRKRLEVQSLQNPLLSALTVGTQVRAAAPLPRLASKCGDGNNQGGLASFPSFAAQVPPRIRHPSTLAASLPRHSFFYFISSDGSCPSQRPRVKVPHCAASPRIALDNLSSLPPSLPP